MLYSTFPLLLLKIIIKGKMLEGFPMHGNAKKCEIDLIIDNKFVLIQAWGRWMDERYRYT